MFLPIFMTRFIQMRIGRPWTGFLGCLLALVLSAYASALLTTPSLALTVPPSEAHKDIDRLYELAVQGENREAAIEGIRAYVERGDIKLPDQQYALTRLEDLTAPELKDYLLRVAMGEVEFENSAYLRAHAHRAYWATLLAEAKDEEDEERILVEALETHVKGVASRTVRRWASEELCRRGKSEYLEKIAWSLNRYKTDSRAQQRIELCRRQIELINMFDSRLAAMKHIFEVVDPTEETALVEWATNELIELQPDEIENIFNDYLLRLQNDLKVEFGNSLYFAPFDFLRKRNWSDDDFKARGIKPMHWV